MSNKKKKKCLTKNSDGDISHDGAHNISCGTAVDAHVATFDLNDEKPVILWYDVHPTFTSGGEIISSVLLPRNFRGWGASGCTIKSSGTSSSNRNIHWYFGKYREN